jgi:hypothetical protein
MPGISPEEMAQMQAQAGPQEEQGEGGDITKLVQSVGEGLNHLAEALNASQAATDQDREQMSQILSSFSNLVEKNLGAGPGEDPQAEEMPAQGAISPEGGAKGVPMGPNSRM